MELSLLLAATAIVLAHSVRALAIDFPVIFAASAVALVASGVGNVLLPPIVKRYFPGHVPLITSLFVGMLAVSAGLPAAFAAPLAGLAGRRAGLGE